MHEPTCQTSLRVWRQWQTTVTRPEGTARLHHTPRLLFESSRRAFVCRWLFLFVRVLSFVFINIQLHAWLESCRCYAVIVKLIYLIIYKKNLSGGYDKTRLYNQAICSLITASVSVFMYVYVCARKCVHVCIHECFFLSVCVCICDWARVCLRVHVCICTRV